jgi:hypothetical protein
MDAACSTLDGPTLGRCSRAITGSATGREANGSVTTIATTTKQVPRPTGFGPLAAPSCCQAAPNTFFPERLNNVSSTASVIAASGASRARTITCDRRMPSVSALQAAREKKEWTRSCGQVRSRFAPVSIPVTVRLPVCPTSPATSAANVAKLGVVNTLAFWSTASSEAGTVGNGSIRGSLPEANSHLRCFFDYPGNWALTIANRPIK